MDINPLFLCDFYKVGHPFQYPKGTTFVYSNLTPRKSRIEGVDKMVLFGPQYFIKEYLIDYFNRNFFSRSREEILAEYKELIKTSLGSDLPTYDHILSLHDLGYIPIVIKALPEGSQVDMRVPCLTIYNTKPEFYWVTNFLETILSACIWQASTSATIAKEYRRIFDKWGEKTGFPRAVVPFQGHDFSFRGMSSFESACLSGAGHLLSFSGTDTIPAIPFLQKYYNATGFIGGSIPATEHSVMCAGGSENELETFRRLITEVYPSGFLSVVSDTWSLWDVLERILPALKDEILGRDGKLVIRPDSGDPADIICGWNSDKIMHLTCSDPDATEDWSCRAFDNWYSNPYWNKYNGESPEVLEWNGRYFLYGGDGYRKDALNKRGEVSKAELKGVIECLWDLFGGTNTNKGFKLLDSHIGAIYGDSISLKVAENICKRLHDKGFVSQCIFGIGSFTYQHITRDTCGLAMKATYVVVNGKEINIFKDPVTDDGTKKSSKGLLRVVSIGQVEPMSNRFYHDHYEVLEEVSWEDQEKGELKEIFRDGKLLKDWTLDEIKSNLNK